MTNARQSIHTAQGRKRAATQNALLLQARAAFAERGFAATSTTAILAAAELTRGALYYHFEDKQSLFRAVFEVVNEEILACIQTASEAGTTPMETLMLGAKAYLEASSAPGRARIYLIDGPAVLGWKTWRDIDGRYSLGALREGVTALLGTPDEAMTLALSGALNELALGLTDQPPRLTPQSAIQAACRLVHGVDLARNR